VSTAAGATARRSSRTQFLWWVLLLVCLGAAAATLYYFVVLAGNETTDNAYVHGEFVQLTPQINGTVAEIGASETDRVKVGQLIVRFDSADAKVAIEQAELALAQAVREARLLFASDATLRAQVAQRESELAVARNELKRVSSDVERRAPLVADGLVAAEEYEHSLARVTAVRGAITVAESALKTSRAQLAANQGLTVGTKIENYPAVLRAAGKIPEAMLALQRTELRAPVDGHIARHNAFLGQRVQAGTPLMTIIALDKVWIEANFKEVQIGSLRIGQPVTLRSDAYGRQVEYKGAIDGLSAGTGSAFALLPTQNASGNWIKIVQRVPVRIKLDESQLKEHPLRVGLSMTARVDVRDTSGKLLSESVRPSTLMRSDEYPAAQLAAQQRVQAIIGEHCGCILRKH
jgi:membrane fusion protein, multidrug efflux system